MELLNLEGKDDRDVIFTVFGLNDLQKSIFQELEDHKLTVQEVASRVDRNRSTVQRALQELMEKDLIMREGRTDQTVYYLYTTLPLDDIKDLTRDALDDWHEQVKSKL
ncbi:helix-turn-helix domain-containing protein [Candidatus Nanohalococcus occultus]|uniref:Transcriptional regulator, contains HTH domain n=1 Tax=Candidatus Nanohalococcus occultus TaxID=2978047 RepID=A0ABY8CFN5_9ARCH|nr:Transcriptional regulator, contains HTH domain [Candidatus Nanohaloarchaeota archaeon SVXNc]